MATTTPQGLADLGACYACGGLLSQYEIFKLGLLRQIALGVSPTADVSTQGLMTSAQCYDCSSYASQGQLLELGLLKIIAGG